MGKRAREGAARAGVRGARGGGASGSPLGVAGNQCCLCAPWFPREKGEEGGRGGPAAGPALQTLEAVRLGGGGARPRGLRQGGVCAPRPGMSGGRRASPRTGPGPSQGSCQVCSAPASGRSDWGRRGESPRRLGRCGPRMPQPGAAPGGPGAAAVGSPRPPDSTWLQAPEGEWAGERRWGSVRMNGVHWAPV